MKLGKRILAAVIVITAVTSGGLVLASGEHKTVSVLLNDKTVNFENGSAYYDSTSERVMVPVRGIAEALGAEVSYEPEPKQVIISKNNTEIILTIGKNTAKIAGVSVELDAPAIITDSVTYVPLRFVSENMNLNVVWDGENSTVKLTEKHNISIGMTKANVYMYFGEPDRTDVSEKGYMWYVYNSNYSDYRMIGINDNKVAAYYIQSPSFLLANGIRSGMTLSACDTLLKSLGYKGEKRSGCSIYTGDDDILTVYWNASDSDKIFAVLTELPKYQNKSRITAAVIESYELQLFDIVNTQRSSYGFEPLTWNDKLASVSKAHSSEMANANYYSHINSGGLSPYQRMEASGFKNFYASEAISKAFPNSFAAFAAHLGKRDYVDVIKARYTQFGSGVAYNSDSDGVLYYTQLFYTEKDD